MRIFLQKIFKASASISDLTWRTYYHFYYPIFEYNVHTLHPNIWRRCTWTEYFKRKEKKSFFFFKTRILYAYCIIEYIVPFYIRGGAYTRCVWKKVTACDLSLNIHQNFCRFLFKRKILLQELLPNPVGQVRLFWADIGCRSLPDVRWHQEPGTKNLIGRWVI